MKWIKSLFKRKAAPTAQERYKAAIKLANDTPPEVLYDLMLLIALQSPMTLVNMLADAGATVSTVEAPAKPVKTNEVIN